MREIVPVAMLGGNRIPEQGRIRMGVKTPAKNGRKAGMTSIDTFRFTSPDEGAIRSLAEAYGGTARPWSDPKANPKQQFEVITTSKAIRVWLPPEAISQWYEQWSGGGCQRRCDGIQCEVPGRSEMEHVPCLCFAQGRLQCKLTTRIKFILPAARPFGGVWRLESKGWNVAQEMPAMEAMLQELSRRGLTEAELHLEQATAQQGSKEFVVPRLKLPFSAEQLVAGAAAIGIGSGGVGTVPKIPQLPPGAPALPEEEGEPEYDVIGADGYDDDDIVDAEIVDGPGVPHSDADPAYLGNPAEAEAATIVEAAFPGTEQGWVTYLREAMKAWESRPELRRIGVEEDDFTAAFTWLVSGKTTPRYDQLTPEQLAKALDVLELIKLGQRELQVTADGDGWIVKVLRPA